MTRRLLCVGGHLHGQVRDMPEGDTLVSVLPQRWNEETEFRQVIYYRRTIGNAKRSMRVLALSGIDDINPWELIDAMAIAYGPTLGVTEHGR